MKYQVKIDDEILSKALSLDEMLDIGLLDEYDEHIMVKGLGESVWRIAREYPFHLSEKKDVGYVIDEYGQVIRKSGVIQFVLSTEFLNFTDNDSWQTIIVTTSGSWNISMGAASWVHLTQSGNTLTVRVDKNYSSDSRTDFFKLKSGDKEKRVDIYQSGASSSSSSSSNNNDNDGCVWAVVVGIGIATLAAIL